MKEEILRLAWQKQGFQLHGKRINLDHDHAPNVLKKRSEYAKAKSVLKEKKNQILNSVPSQIKSVLSRGDGAVRISGGSNRGHGEEGSPVLVIKHQESLLEQIQGFTWRTSRRLGNRERAGKVGG